MTCFTRNKGKPDYLAFYEGKGEAYFQGVRKEAIAEVSPGMNRVLEVGCGKGKTGKVLKEVGRAKEVIGIELVPEIAKRAQENLDSVLCGDVEEMALPFPENSLEDAASSV